MDDPLISIGKCAREIGINKSTLSRQIKAGLIRSRDGAVRLSEVLEDRANNIDKSIWANRSKNKSEPSPAPLHATVPVAEALHATLDDEDDDPDDTEVIVDGGAMPLGHGAPRGSPCVFRRRARSHQACRSGHCRTATRRTSRS